VLLLIPALPLLGSLVNAFGGRRLGRRASGGIATGAVLASWIASFVMASELLALPPDARSLSASLGQWITSGSLTVDFALRLDPLSSVMILVVTGVGTLIHLYSMSYMHESDAASARFFSYLNLFVAFMLVLVLGANFLVMFVGWEGVGLCSYLLIGFYYERQAAADAGKKAFIVNRIGDVGFVLGVLMVFTQFGTLDFQEVARRVAGLTPETTVGVLTAITLLLFVGATGKSAQIPLFVWLPDAMEGPTPVSALIHAATMVTAGVYMIGRNAVLFSHAPLTLTVVATIGAATALVAGTIGLVQTDIKRVLAYSTVSQLGYMFLAMGVGAYAAGIFHLYTHAFFKALLFLGAGAVIHALAGQQDLRHMGGLRRALPLTYWTFVVGAVALAGVPGFAGFFSKDEILYRTFASGHTVLWIVALLTSLLTATYMFRLVFLVFHGEPAAASASAPGERNEPDAPREPVSHLHDAPPLMAIALLVLAVGSVAAGYIGVSRFTAYVTPSFTASGSPAMAGESEPGDSATEFALMVLSSAIAVGGIGLAWYYFVSNRRAAASLSANAGWLRTLFVHKYYVDEIYDRVIVQPIESFSAQVLWQRIDLGIIDGAVNGVGELVRRLAADLRRFQTGSVRTYGASLLLGVVVVLGYFFWP
jgi:NADH-quinone oxidoreductase subunit L